MEVNEENLLLFIFDNMTCKGIFLLRYASNSPISQTAKVFAKDAPEDFILHKLTKIGR